MYLSGPKGVSLTELFIVLALLSVIAGIAIPGYSSMIKNYNLQKAVRQVITDLQLAKMQAISEGVQYQIYFNNGNSSYVIEQGNKSSDSTSWIPVQVTRTLKEKSNPYYSKDISLFQNFPDDRAIFSPIGISSMGTVKMSLDSCTDGKASCQSSPKRNCEKCVTTLLSGRIGIVQ